MPNQFARHLRRNQTDAERRLWHELRFLKSEGFHFRRQVPIGAYIADFACFRRRLIVELDGGQHNTPENRGADERRTKDLQNRGFRVLRFWNIDVFEGLEGVVDRIRNGVGLPTLYSYDNDVDLATPAPNPSPQGGGEQN
jgi:very-short-patch-repair endonuclease